MEHVVIIGNGVSGIAVARHLRKLSHPCRITVVSGETKHHYSRTALMYIYMGHMKYEHTKPYPDNFWPSNAIDLRKDWVGEVDFENKKLRFSSQQTLSYDKLVFALGSKPNIFDWKGKDLKAVGGLYSYQDLEKMEKYSATTQRAVIIGGGLIGLEMAEMFKSRGIEVTLLVREKSYWGNVLPERESLMITQHIRDHHIDVRLSEELEEIIGDENGRACAIITKSGERIDCQFVGLTAGVQPNITWLKNQNSLKVEKGILVNEFLETNVENVYAVGDCVQHEIPPDGRRSIEQVWYTGKIMGETLAQTISGNPMKYQPGIWYNSAKFLDIEYQTYGWINSSLGEEESSLFWSNESNDKCIHIVYDSLSKIVKGVNLLGIRHRHQIWEFWIKNSFCIDEVLLDLEAANFDPEFFKRFELAVLTSYNKQEGTNLKPRRRKGLNSVLKIIGKS